jgi:hypothetical protein
VNRRDTFILVGVITAAGVAAFGVGRTAALRHRTGTTGPQVEWLRGVSAQTVQAEERFEQQSRQWMEDVRAKQAALTSMLPDDRFTGAQILGQVDEVAQSYAVLARSVGKHIFHLRSVLPEGQRQQVMQACANSLRACMQRRYRWRGGAQDQGPGFMGGGRGGWGRGQGRGAGYGRQYRGGRGQEAPGLVGRLRLTQEQSVWIRQQDPNFDAESAVLRDRLCEVHAELVASLEEANLTERELSANIDLLITAHEALEKRVAQHIVLLRPQLSQEQRDLLGGLCRGSAHGVDVSAATSPGLPSGILAGLLSPQVLTDLLQ